MKIIFVKILICDKSFEKFFCVIFTDKEEENVENNDIQWRVPEISSVDKSTILNRKKKKKSGTLMLCLMSVQTFWSYQ